MAYHRVHRIDTRIVRIFNTYGPRMRLHDGRVVPNFIDQALHNRPLTVYGRGNQTRSFCYVSDLVEGIYRLLFLSNRAGSCVHEPFNLGNPCEFTILAFARLVIRITGTKSRVIFKPLPQDDPRQRKPDISKSKRILRWYPRVNLEDGLAKTISWFRNNL